MDEMKYSDFWKFIKLLHDNDLLGHVIVIGSWAEYLYAQSGILPGFTANLRTLDIDFLIRNMRRPAGAASITVLAKEAGYTVDQDILDGVTKIYTPELMEIEFLISQQGSGEETILKTSLGVNAQALRHLSLLRDNTLTVELFDIAIPVPEPEAYVLHKMIINSQRGKKTEKDRAAIDNLLPYLNNERFEELRTKLTSKEKAAVNSFMEQISG